MPELNFDMELLLRYFTHNTTFEQNLITFISSQKVNIYSPLVVFDKLICDGIRPLESFKERMNVLPENFSGESILDLGCNNGYMLIDLKKNRNAGRCDGIDNDQTAIFLAQSIIYHERINNIFFSTDIISNVVKKILSGEINKFDNILCFGVFEFNQNIENDIIPDLVKCANKKVIIEIANHPHSYKTEEEIEEYVKAFDQFGKIKTTFLEYQGRPVIEIDVSEKQNEKQPIILSL